MKTTSVIRLGTVGLALLAISSCTDKGVLYLTRVSDEQTGTNCTDGGQKLEFGPDSDSNGELSSSEISATAFVCNGAASRGALVTNTALPVGDAHCAGGGFALTVGVDRNQNGLIDADEGVPRYVCSAPPGGTAGAPGPQGAEGDAGVPGPLGTNGSDGATGASGVDGLVTLTTVTPVLSSVKCPDGGVLVSSGLDLNRDNVLNPDTFSTVPAEPEPIRVNNNDGEATSETEICNGANGFDTVFEIDESKGPIGEQCPAGGFFIYSALDKDRDGVLSNGDFTGDEKPIQTILCHGKDGLASVIAVRPLKDDLRCPPQGGIEIFFGRDLNNNGVFDFGSPFTNNETDGSSVVCNGATGATGPVGPAGAVANGGSCASNTECSSGFCASGSCALAPDGTSCTVDSQCSGGFCNGSSQCATPPLADGANCAVGTQCTGGFCNRLSQCATPPLADGASCEVGTNCTGGICNAANQCATPLSNGASCLLGSECSSGFCDASGACALAPDGTSCTLDSQCSGGFCNGSSQCATPPLADGENCAVGTQCTGGICNAANQCATPLANGAACTSGAECASEFCNASSVCAAAGSPTGVPCDFNIECTSGLCIVGLCQ